MSAAGKHTPGPWVVGNGNPLLFGRPQGNGTEPIGFVYGPGFPERSDVGLRAMADARLIAAAPDLLDACEEALGVLNGAEVSLPDYVVKKLERAIAAATQSANTPNPFPNED